MCREPSDSIVSLLNLYIYRTPPQLFLIPSHTKHYEVRFIAQFQVIMYAQLQYCLTTMY